MALSNEEDNGSKSETGYSTAPLDTLGRASYSPSQDKRPCEPFPIGRLDSTLCRTMSELGKKDGRPA